MGQTCFKEISLRTGELGVVHFSTQFFNLDEAKPGFLILLSNLKTVKGRDNEGWESGGGRTWYGEVEDFDPKFLPPPPHKKEKIKI